MRCGANASRGAATVIAHTPAEQGMQRRWAATAIADEYGKLGVRALTLRVHGTNRRIGTSPATLLCRSEVRSQRGGPSRQSAAGPAGAFQP
eukprot:278887-Chlamydomonas_euryale.AAC.1